MGNTHLFPRSEVRHAAVVQKNQAVEYLEHRRRRLIVKKKVSVAWAIVSRRNVVGGKYLPGECSPRTYTRFRPEASAS